MARGDQLGRQWKILQVLSASHQGRSVADLSSELDCNKRTVYRDLEALQIAGFPVTSEIKEGKNIWSVLGGEKHSINIPFNLTELMALYLSRDMLKALKGTVFSESIESLFQKVRAILPPESSEYLKQVESSIQTGHSPYKPVDEDNKALESINDAIISRCYIDMVYYTMSRKKTDKRRVAPYRILVFNSTFYLIGYCMVRNSVRIFAIDRVKELEITTETFPEPDTFQIDELMKSSFGIFQGNRTSVRLWFSPEVSGHIKEKIWHNSQILTDNKDGSLIFEAEVAGTDEIKIWIRKWGKGVKVLEPASLKNEMITEARSIIAMYEEQDD